MRAVPFFIIACLGWLSVHAGAESFAEADRLLLEKMLKAAKQTTYSGTYIYQSGNYIETSRITHVFDGENEHERVEGLNGERSELIRRNGEVWCYMGDSKTMVAKRNNARTFPALLPGQLELLQENYTLRHAEDDRVAGFPARSIIFQPRDRMRYLHKMWMNGENGLLLKAVVQDANLHTIEQYAFTQLDLGGGVDKSWIRAGSRKSSAASQDAHDQNSISVIEGESGWKALALPAGFRKIKEVTRQMRGNPSPVTQLTYSDGLSGISIFVEKLGDKTGIHTGPYGKGVIQVYSLVQDGYLLTVVGEVPARTVRQVAESIRRTGS